MLVLTRAPSRALVLVVVVALLAAATLYPNFAYVQAQVDLTGEAITDLRARLTEDLMRTIRPSLHDVTGEADSIHPEESSEEEAEGAEETIAKVGGADDESSGPSAEDDDVVGNIVKVAQDRAAEDAAARAACFATEYSDEQLSLLRRVKTHGKVFKRPFPYLVVREALDPCLYRQLEAQFLDDRQFYRAIGLRPKLVKQNERLNVPASISAESDLVSPLWKRFVAYHTSPEFFAEVQKLWGSEVKKAHPSLPSRPEAGTRYRDTFTEKDVLLDCQIGINSPVKQPSTVRGPHIDKTDEVYAGLLYLRHPNDTQTEGGAFQVAKCKNFKEKEGNRPPVCKSIPRAKRYATSTGETMYKTGDLDIMNTVDYAANTFVMFINGRTAIHAVTPRSVTRFSRRLVNIVATKGEAGAASVGAEWSAAANRNVAASRARSRSRAAHG